MTPELFWLTLTVILGATMWVPYIVGVNTTPVPQSAENRPIDVAGTVPWVHRAWRAHLNLLEQMLPFAVIVLIAHLTGVSTGITAFAAASFFGLRVAHAVWMIGGFPVLPVRPIIFTLGWACVMAIAVEVLRLA